MKRSMVETILGAVVLAGAVGFLAFSYSTANVSTGGGYTISANFSGIGGLKIGDEVQISGVKVGQVGKVELDPKTYLARVTLDLNTSLQLPEDTAALISSTSLLGGRFVSLEPGGAENMIPDGGSIQFTQDPQNLEQLLGKFIFSMSDKEKAADGAASDATSDIPEDTAAEPAPVAHPAEQAAPDAAPAAVAPAKEPASP